ncbi:ATP-binding protein [bacterium]|nr:ATP-binding protein [bacterium]
MERGRNGNHVSRGSKGITVTVLATDFRFETFIPGDENVLAIEAANKVVLEPGDRYNPLFLFGPPSVGKSHLLCAIRNRLEEVYPSWNVLYLPACEFVDECESTWRQKTNFEFRQQLWKLDALLIDDIHLIEKSEPAKEELYHAFNQFVANGKQLVFTSRESPADLMNLSLALRQRLQSGLVVHIDPPRERLLRDLIEAHSNMSGIRPSQKATSLLCREIRNARELNGIFNELRQSLPGSNRSVSLEEVRTVLQKHAAEQLKVSDVAKTVCEYFNVDIVRVRSASRQQSLVQARQLAMYLVREMTAAPLTQIGQYFGGRDHTTVLYACRKVAEDIHKSAYLAQAAREVRAMLRG